MDFQWFMTLLGPRISMDNSSQGPGHSAGARADVQRGGEFLAPRARPGVVWSGENSHGKTMGKPWENGGLMGFHGTFQ